MKYIQFVGIYKKQSVLKLRNREKNTFMIEIKENYMSDEVELQLPLQCHIVNREKV